MMRICACLAAAVVLAPTLACAQAQAGQVITASAPAPPPPVQPATTEVSTVPLADVEPIEQAPPPDHRVHADVTVGVGTGGYRQGEATVQGPIGATGYGSITVGASQDAWRRW